MSVCTCEHEHVESVCVHTEHENEESVCVCAYGHTELCDAGGEGCAWVGRPLSLRQWDWPARLCQAHGACVGVQGPGPQHSSSHHPPVPCPRTVAAASSLAMCSPPTLLLPLKVLF